MATKYKFSHSYVNADGAKMLVWQSTTRLPNDSRVEQITCSANWFWDTPICGSRGPRIGEEGMPVCKRPPNHKGLHRPYESDGWGASMSWGIPLSDGRYY